MKHVSIVLCLTGMIFLSGCDSAVLWTDGKYEVHWIDTGENREIGYILDNGDTIGRVIPTIIAVGSDSRYLVAEQIDLDTKKVHYYYLDKSKDNKYLNMSDITKGPFNKVQFAKISKELSLPDFQKEFH